MNTHMNDNYILPTEHNRRPDISVCIPVYNDLDSFSRCIASVLQQKDIVLECVVNDDSTTNDIAEYVESMPDARIVYRRNEERLGPVFNWNATVQQATGEYITLLHQDDWYRSETTLKKIYAIFQNTGADALFCGRALYQDWKLLGEYPMSLEKVEKFRRFFPGRTLVVNTLGHPSVAFFHQRHKDLLYDTALVYFADTEYYTRLIRTSKKIAVYEEPHVAISRSDKQLSATCLAKLDALVPQLAHGLRKHNATHLESGLALARFFAGNIRHWRGDNIAKAYHRARAEFSTLILSITVLSFPVFFVHMLYRALYRRTTGKVWG